MSSPYPIAEEVISRLIKDLQELQLALSQRARRVSAAAAPAPAKPPSARLFIPTGESATLAGIAEQVEAAERASALAEAISSYKELPWDDHDFTTAPEPVNSAGNSYDLGRVVDFIMVEPTIDAQIEFDRNIKPTTPVVSGGTIFRWNLRARKVYYKAVSTTLEGQLFVWAAWWK